MELTDAQWGAIESFFPESNSGPGRRGRPARSYRDVLNGIVWILRTGAPWKDMPSRFPPATTCFGRFQQWSRSGVLRRVLESVRDTLVGEGFILPLST